MLRRLAHRVCSGTARIRISEHSDRSLQGPRADKEMETGDGCLLRAPQTEKEH